MNLKEQRQIVASACIDFRAHTRACVPSNRVFHRHGTKELNWCDVMAAFPSEKIPVMTTLAAEYAVMDRMFCSHPGPTWPNRLYVMSHECHLPGSALCQPIKEHDYQFAFPFSSSIFLLFFLFFSSSFLCFLLM